MGEERFRAGKFGAASDLFDQITTDDNFVEFLTLPGYDKLN
jgi:malate synthase